MTSHEATVETLKAVLEAFNSHDLDRIMSFFSEDCILEMPRGPDPWGSRYVGAAVDQGRTYRRAGMRLFYFSRRQNRQEGFLLEDSRSIEGVLGHIT